MVNFPFIPMIVASAILLLMWSLRKIFINFFTKEQENSFLGDVVLGMIMIFLPSFALNTFVNNSLLVSILIFGITYELYGFLLYKIEKINGVGVLSFLRKKMNNA
jgi:hypothetical protein